MKSTRFLKALVGLAVVGAVGLGVSVVNAGQSDEAQRKRLEVLEAGQRAILKQLEEIKTLLQARPAPQPPMDVQQAQAALTQPPKAPLDISGAASVGSQNAKLTLLEFSDFQCPFCGRHTKETLEKVKHDYVDTGKVRYVFRNFPLERIHPNAFKAAEAGECARQQGKFWELHGRLFANQQALADVDLLNHAKAVGLDASAFQRCVTSPSVATRIREDLDEGARAGVSGTPSFFIGTVQKDGKLQVLRRLTGAQPFTAFKTTIDGLLASPELAK